MCTKAEASRIPWRTDSWSRLSPTRCRRRECEMANGNSADSFETLKAATCLIESAGKKGTGYLVSANRIVTCLHVVEDAKTGQPVKVTFSDRPTSMAFRTDLVDPSADTAVLDWRTPFPDIVPLRLMLAPP